MMLSVALLLAGLTTACRPRISVLAIDEREHPLAHLDDGNYVVTPGYVYYHVQMMAKIARLEAKIEELQKALEKR